MHAHRSAPPSPCSRLLLASTAGRRASPCPPPAASRCRLPGRHRQPAPHRRRPQGRRQAQAGRVPGLRQGPSRHEGARRVRPAAAPPRPCWPRRSVPSGEVWAQNAEAESPSCRNAWRGRHAQPARRWSRPSTTRSRKARRRWTSSPSTCPTTTSPTRPTDRAAMNKRLYDALKPGGMLVIVDNAAKKGAGLSRHQHPAPHRRGHRGRRKSRKAGFKLDGSSDYLHVPARSARSAFLQDGRQAGRQVRAALREKIKPYQGALLNSLARGLLWNN